MNITLMAHDKKKELMVQFCTAYKSILSKHSLSATAATGRLVSEATGLPVTLFLSKSRGGHQQIDARIAYNEIDLVIMFSDPNDTDPWEDQRIMRTLRLCDSSNVPCATNLASAEMLILGLQRGRFREFYQADIDIIGDGKLSITNEAEIPSIIYKTFSTLGLRRFQIRVNNRKILNGFYAMLGLSEQSGDIMRTVDKLDKIGSDKVRVLLVEECGVEETKADEILTFIAIRGTNGEVLSALEQYRGRNEVFDQGLDELSSVTKLLGAFGVPEENFAVDLTIARGLDYYTGTVYETTLLDHPEIGSVCSGGRYDNLAEYYTDRPLPGVGISIGLTRLFYVLNEQRMLNEERVMAPADVMIVPMTDDLEAAVRLATELRAQNIRVQLYAEQKKFKAKIQYADKLHIPYVVFLGEDEIAAGTVSLKDLRTGDQVTVPAQDAAARILADIELRGQGTILK